MKFVKKYNSFLEEFTFAEPTVKPDVKPEVKPDTTEAPQPPSPIRRERTSPVPSPAKAELKKATADDVAKRFIQLLHQSGDDVKKYVEKK